MENNNILEQIAKTLHPFKGELSNTQSISGIDSDLYEIAAEILGRTIDKKVWLTTNNLGNIAKDTLPLSIGQQFHIQEVLDIGFERVERVWSEGDISILGDIVVVWPFSMNNILRISLNGELIEAIDIVDTSSRKKISSVQECTLLAHGSNIYIGNDSQEGNTMFKIVPNIGDIQGFNLGLRRIPGIENFGNKKVLYEIINNFKSRGFTTLYITGNLSDYEKLEDTDLKSKIDEIYSKKDGFGQKIDRGFVVLKSKVLVLTDLEVLGELDLSQYQDKDSNIDPNSVEILKKILPNDYIVHEDHGIGKFVGIADREHGQYIEIAYAGQDRLFVPLSAAQKVTKYIGAGKQRPTLTGLNSGVWKRISQKAKERVEEIAKELLQLYALRQSTQSPIVIDTEESLQSFNIFVDQFEFKDTDDQLLATKHIVDDFQSTKPMDRLLVGDVGFGKTEIAMRAVYATVNAGYQAAILAPTTILVEQHLAVFKERFKNYPFNIVTLSRFSSSQEKDSVKRGLSNGVVDIVIGTHSLLSDDIEFKNLGILVVDEEQKFGVKQKEKIKKTRVSTNVLSLTATPIPRTLNMALTGIRDISVLAVPPLGRKEIMNHFEKFNWDSVYHAIQKEFERKGQVYFLHNRVGNIQSIHDKLKEIFPDSRISIVHGQMGAEKLANSMYEFVSGNTDILVCTTIIENGLDISTANTLIIDDASKLGLSQMYQIRGRIGRSTEQAYSYFFYDTLGGDSEQRLEALRDSQALGSGFLLSNKDLEIRGSGDILGQNQSGAINSVGYGLYTQMLQETMDEIRKKDRGKRVY